MERSLNCLLYTLPFPQCNNPIKFLLDSTFPELGEQCLLSVCKFSFVISYLIVNSLIVPELNATNSCVPLKRVPFWLLWCLLDSSLWLHMTLLLYLYATYLFQCDVFFLPSFPSVKQVTLVYRVS